jgi:hypothetical protein
MPDGAHMDKGSNNLFATFNAIAPTATWEQVFRDQLDRWAANSNNHVAFAEHSDAGLKFNYSGAAQNDSRSGDIRIGAHRFDGTNKVLAHTYYPPPNGATAAGDSHYDSAEAWVLGAGFAASNTGPGGTVLDGADHDPVSGSGTAVRDATAGALIGLSPALLTTSADGAVPTSRLAGPVTAGPLGDLASVVTRVAEVRVREPHSDSNGGHTTVTHDATAHRDTAYRFDLLWPDDLDLFPSHTRA